MGKTSQKDQQLLQDLQTFADDYKTQYDACIKIRKNSISSAKETWRQMLVETPFLFLTDVPLDYVNSPELQEVIKGLNSKRRKIDQKQLNPPVIPNVVCQVTPSTDKSQEQKIEWVDANFDIPVEIDTDNLPLAKQTDEVILQDPESDVRWKFQVGARPRNPPPVTSTKIINAAKAQVPAAININKKNLKIQQAAANVIESIFQQNNNNNNNDLEEGEIEQPKVEKPAEKPTLNRGPTKSPQIPVRRPVANIETSIDITNDIWVDLDNKYSEEQKDATWKAWVEFFHYSGKTPISLNEFSDFSDNSRLIAAGKKVNKELGQSMSFKDFLKSKLVPSSKPWARDPSFASARTTLLRRLKAIQSGNFEKPSHVASEVPAQVVQLQTILSQPAKKIDPLIQQKREEERKRRLAEQQLIQEDMAAQRAAEDLANAAVVAQLLKQRPPTILEDKNQSRTADEEVIAALKKQYNAAQAIQDLKPKTVEELNTLVENLISTYFQPYLSDDVVSTLLQVLDNQPSKSSLLNAFDPSKLRYIPTQLMGFRTGRSKYLEISKGELGAINLAPCVTRKGTIVFLRPYKGLIPSQVPGLRVYGEYTDKVMELVKEAGRDPYKTEPSEWLAIIAKHDLDFYHDRQDQNLNGLRLRIGTNKVDEILQRLYLRPDTEIFRYLLINRHKEVQATGIELDSQIPAPDKYKYFPQQAHYLSYLNDLGFYNRWDYPIFPDNYLKLFVNLSFDSELRKYDVFSNSAGPVMWNKHYSLDEERPIDEMGRRKFEGRAFEINPPFAEDQYTSNVIELQENLFLNEIRKYIIKALHDDPLIYLYPNNKVKKI
jgi:hypothetical protein